MKINKRCDHHITQEERKREKKRDRPVLEKRNWLKIGDIVTTTDEYNKLYKKSDNKYYKAKIIEFDDPCEWETGDSISRVELTCGCTETINTSWLKKI